MSGGSLSYFCYTLEEHVGDFADKELDGLVKDLAQLFHEREWYLSADTCEGNWKEARDAFKEKWFTEHGRQERIEQYLAEIAREVRDAFGMDTHRCQTCRRWHLDQKSDVYGRCDFKKSCRMHRSESCEKWEDENG